MHPQHLAELIASSRAGDQIAREELLRFHYPFIQQVTSRLCGRPVDLHQDEFSVALLALNEAIDRYEGRGGASFLTYATVVMRHRLVDHFRHESRGLRTAPMNLGGEASDEQLWPAAVREAWERYDAEQEERQTAEEIAIMVTELGRYGITLDDLIASSPKHRDTKANLLNVVRVILSQPELLDYLRRTRQLPLKELERITGVSRKVLDSGRRYIVAVTVVMQLPELTRIRTHIRLPDLKEVASSRE
ncbi:MAG: sigma-70 family RNA polymerase sigma factor [Bacillota bacterium]